VLLDAPAEVMQIEDDLANAAGAQELEDVLEEGPAATATSGFGCCR